MSSLAPAMWQVDILIRHEQKSIGDSTALLSAIMLVTTSWCRTNLLSWSQPPRWVVWTCLSRVSELADLPFAGCYRIWICSRAFDISPQSQPIMTAPVKFVYSKPLTNIKQHPSSLPLSSYVQEYETWDSQIPRTFYKHDILSQQPVCHNYRGLCTICRGLLCLLLR